MTLRHWCTWYQAMYQCTAVGDATSFRRDEWFSRRKLGSFDIMSLVWIGFSSKLQVGCFKWNLVPNVVKNMADLINIKQMYICSLFCRSSRSFKRCVKLPRLAPMHGIYSWDQFLRDVFGLETCGLGGFLGQRPSLVYSAPSETTLVWFHYYTLHNKNDGSTEQYSDRIPKNYFCHEITWAMIYCTPLGPIYTYHSPQGWVPCICWYRIIV
jgi:hypothetical protein